MLHENHPNKSSLSYQRDPRVLVRNGFGGRGERGAYDAGQTWDARAGAGTEP